MTTSMTWMREKSVYIVAVIASAILSLWISDHQTVINPDAICYLYSAEELGKSGFRNAMHLCPQAKWPFYSILVYGFQQITHLSYTNSAYCLDGIFSALSVVAFVAIVKELGAARRTLWFAAMVILLSHEFNSVRQYIIRDHGFWAFYLGSLYFLLRYFRDVRWQDALCFSISLGVAALFRIEGAVFLLLLPFAAWFNREWSWRERAISFVTLNGVVILIGVMLLGWLAFYSHHSLEHLGRVAEIPHQLRHGLTFISNQFQTTKSAVMHNVLSQASARDAGLVVFLTFISWYFVNIIDNLSWIYAVLVAYAWISRSSFFTRSARVVVLGYVIVNLFITGAFFAENLFLAKRYLIGLSLILMLWVPFVLERLIRSRYRKVFYVAVVCIVITSLGGIFRFGHSKDYIREAGDWLAESMPQNATLYTNDYQVMYYSHRFGSHIFEVAHSYADINKIAHGKWKHYDYLALQTSKKPEDKMAWLMQEIHVRPVEIFVSNNGDSVYIYKISKG